MSRDRSDTNRPVKSQKKARHLKFWIEVEERLSYPSSENKGADQLCRCAAAQLICTFVFAQANTQCFHDAAHM